MPLSFGHLSAYSISCHRACLNLSIESFALSIQTRYYEWNISQKHKKNCHINEIWLSFREKLFHTASGNATCSKHDSAHRRSNAANSQVESKYHSKMDGIDSIARGNRGKQRGKDDCCRTTLHEHAYNNKHDINNQQEHILV